MATTGDMRFVQLSCCLLIVYGVDILMNGCIVYNIFSNPYCSISVDSEDVHLNSRIKVTFDGVLV